MILETTVALSLFFGTPNVGCKETRFYYNRNYYAVDVITFVDSTIKDISAINNIFPVNTDSSFFRYQEYIALDYKQLDMVFSYVVNSSSNIISTNGKNINLENCLWVINAYKDV